MASQPKEIAAGVYCLRTGMSNVYFVRSGASWTLIDAAWANSAHAITRAAEALFGRGARPAAILLTHIHPDHSGAAGALACMWGLPVYVHPAELPLASGRLIPEYANPLDRRLVGPIMRVLPPRVRAAMNKQSNIADVTRALDSDAPPPGLPDWECIHTPGHTPGHVAFFRRSDGTLIAGDACLTVDTNSIWGLLLNKQAVSAPPSISTWNWQAAKASIAAVARLDPRVLATGHGAPMSGPALAQQLRAFAARLSGAGAAVGRARRSSLRSQLIRRTVGLVVWQYRRTRGRSARLFRAPGELLLLTTRGRTSGQRRTVPLQGFRDGDDLVVVAANNGQAANPGWYYNLKATPWAQVELLGRVVQVRAEELAPGEAAAFWRRLAQIAPAYVRTQQRTPRAIPLMRLVPVALPGEQPTLGDDRRWAREVEAPAVRSHYARLSPIDTLQLRTESSSMPNCIGGLCVVEAGPLLDANGLLDLETITRRLERRLPRVPELRRIIAPAPPLGGSLIWVDDPHFSIRRHIHTTVVDAPGDEASLLETSERLLRPLLDRSRPLWELWFITGLKDCRVALLFKLHHAIADGLAAIALISSFFDLAPDAPDPPATAWTPSPAPSSRALIVDNVRYRVATAGDALRRPTRAARRVAALLAYTARAIPVWTAAPRTSLNTLIKPGRYQRVLHLDLETARAVAHAHGAKINDVILALVTGGVRALLLRRGESVADMELLAGVPASLRSLEAARKLGNVVGALTVRLPVGEADPVRRLERVTAATRAAKTEQPLSEHTTRFALGLVGWLATRGYSFTAQQRMINFMVSNVIGPTSPLYVLGARIADVMPLSGPFGNVTLAFGAMSYCGRLDLVIIADRTACPDIDTLVAGMQRTWEELARVAAAV